VLSAEGAGAPFEDEAFVDAFPPAPAEPGAELPDEELEPLAAPPPPEPPPPPWASAKVDAKAYVAAAKMVSAFMRKLLS